MGVKEEARSAREQAGKTRSGANGPQPPEGAQAGANGAPAEGGTPFVGKGRARERREACPKGGKSGADFARTQEGLDAVAEGAERDKEARRPRAREQREACPKGGKSGADFATTERDKVYLYLVRHPELGETEALAENRLRAVCAAAKIWGVPWTSIATACKCERVEKRE